MAIEIKNRGIHLNSKDKPIKVDQPKPAKDNKEFIPDPYKKVANGMERQFVEFMVNQMNKTVGKEDEQDSGMNYYKSLLNSERSKSITENRGGVGVQELILNQIYPERLRTPQNHQAFLNRNKNVYEKQNLEMHNHPKKEQKIGINKQEAVHE